MTGLQMNSIAICCRNAAIMLEIADEAEPDKEKRSRIQKANRGQAKLLRECADRLDREIAQIGLDHEWLREDRLLYGSSFECGGVRVDPAAVQIKTEE